MRYVQIKLKICYPIHLIYKLRLGLSHLINNMVHSEPLLYSDTMRA